MAIFGRSEETSQLDKIFQSHRAEFLVVYGRRRIGKTYLINQYFKNKGIYFELSGQKEAAMATQLDNFALELGDVFYKGKTQQAPQSWNEAFTQLRHQIEKITNSKKVILFFDELPWLATSRSDFLGALDYFWNRYLSRRNNIVLIGCGSAASWMIDNLINNKGGLHNRVTHQIRLLPFNLDQTYHFLKAQNVILNQKQVMEIYMALGGVAGYLIHVKPALSAAQTINDICFGKNGALVSEFYKLYRSLFDHHERHINVIKQLAKTFSGLSQEELFKKAGLPSGGSSSQVIKELEESGFVMQVPEYGGISKGARYRLMDEFSLFFLKWMEKAPNSVISEIEPDYWLKKRTNATWPIWAGYVFENLCLKHIKQLKTGLGIAAVNTLESNWLYRPEKGSQGRGAQIDLIIDRADDVVNLCEIKYCSKEYVVTKQYANQLNQKKELFREITRTKKSLLTTLITPYGGINNSYYLSAIDSQLTMDVFFK